MNVPGAILLRSLALRSSCNLDSRLSAMRATKRTNQTFSLRQQGTSERTRAHEQKNNLVLSISALQWVDQVVYEHEKRKETALDACLSVDAASHRAGTYIHYCHMCEFAGKMSICLCVWVCKQESVHYGLIPFASDSIFQSIDCDRSILIECDSSRDAREMNWHRSRLTIIFLATHCQVNRKTNHIFVSNEHLEGVGEWFTRDIFLICHFQWFHVNRVEDAAHTPLLGLMGDGKKWKLRWFVSKTKLNKSGRWRHHCRLDQCPVHNGFLWWKGFCPLDDACHDLVWQRVVEP